MAAGAVNYEGDEQIFLRASEELGFVIHQRFGDKASPTIDQLAKFSEKLEQHGAGEGLLKMFRADITKFEFEFYERNK
ncbi:hypothetical protein JDV02_003094 [Purpureocillium takamizusanense]|uniref:Uncharacterized protein n=1 Tax=Purpureocillium takamizusanense TaxID=2060973 RepID=A0A9Q8QBQ4_9HYPO|nr:uncharacterized protein JDV02_003094 [Purpureocillium takamizusanense]UNI16680.1 hypothetical protein JDV02_003094 [Purpureocillium takamizusanense]